MTVKELSEAVKSLISEYDCFDSDKFFTSANTALGTVFSETDCIGRASIYLSAPKILQHTEKIRHSPGGKEEIKLFGMAYSMRLFGDGCAVINDGQNVITHTFNGWGLVLRGMLKGEGYVRLRGDFAYTVKDITLFCEVEGACTEDIPVLGEKRSVEIDRFVPDFSRALSYPTDEKGTPLADVNIENGYIRCPKDFSGEIYFSYKKRPPKLCCELFDIEIPIPAEAEPALTLLTAAYFLGEGECDAAEFFIREYKRCMSRISAKNMPSAGDRYFDTTGWA